MSTRKNTMVPDGFWLTVHIRDFLNSLAIKGYTKRTIRLYKNTADRICCHAEAQGIGPEELNAELFDKLIATCPCTGSSSMEYMLSLGARLITEYLIDEGIITHPPEDLSAGGPREQLILELDNWLKSNRGLYGENIYRHYKACSLFLDHFGKATGDVDDLASLTPGRIHDFLDKHAGKSGWRIRYVRNILRFLFWSGRISRDLSLAIPPVAGRRLKNITPHVDTETVEKLLAAIRDNTPLALRDYAALLLMARLGLRTEEVVAMRLDDIDWSIGRILIRGKRGDKSYMPLPVDVGNGLIEWLRHGRRGSSRHVFVSVRPPFQPLTTSRSFCKAFRKAYNRVGLTPSDGKFRTHSLRHGLAMTLLEKGNSLAEISDVLRHRSMQTTTIYARHDIKALRPLARAWPIEGGVQ